MKIKPWGKPEEQMAKISKDSWSVCRLHQLARDLPVMEIPLDHLATDYRYEVMLLPELVMHMKATNDADLSLPIIMDENGIIMDGRHRLMKALLNGIPTIKAVRFEENPSPCRTEES